MVTHPASSASTVARANRGLRIMDLPIVENGVIAEPNPAKFTLRA
jgi:hypothetical protein